MSNFEFKVSLRFEIPDRSIDPDEISEQLKLSPLAMHKVGNPRVDKKENPLGGTYEYSFCIYELTPLANEDLTETLNRIADDLEQHSMLLKKIKAVRGVISFYIGWFTSRNSGESFESELLSKLGRLGIGLDLDVYGED